MSSAIPLADQKAQPVLPGSWKKIRFINRYLPFLSRSFFKGLARRLQKNTQKEIDASIAQMPAPDQRLFQDTTFRERFTRVMLEAYGQTGEGIYYDALALSQPLPFSLSQVVQPTDI